LAFNRDALLFRCRHYISGLLTGDVFLGEVDRPILDVGNHGAGLDADRLQELADMVGLAARLVLPGCGSALLGKGLGGVDRARLLGYDVSGPGIVEVRGRPVDSDAGFTLAHLDRGKGVHLISVGVVEPYCAFALIAQLFLGPHLPWPQFVFGLSLSRRLPGLRFK